MRKLLFLSISIAAPLAFAQSTRYVTDSLRLEGRTGPGTEHRIVKMLDSGTRVQVLEDKDGWSRISLPETGEFWILTRYLMDEPSARSRIETMSKRLDSARDESKKYKEELAALRVANEELRTTRASLEERSQSLAEELAELKRTAASAVAIRNHNRELEQKVGSLENTLEGLEQDYVMLRRGRDRDWFVAGAGVLLVGLVLGLIIPKIRWRRRRSWSEL